MEIHLRKQVDDMTCTTACLAMILNKPVTSLLKDFHTHYCRGILTPQDFLKEHNVKSNTCGTLDKFSSNGLYLVAVPSLNNEATLHNIVVLVKDGVINVYDPNEGRLGRRYYVGSTDTNPQAVKIKHYIIDLQIYI